MNIHPPTTHQRPAWIPVIDQHSEPESLAALLEPTQLRLPPELATNDALAALSLLRQLQRHSTSRQQPATLTPNLLLISPPTSTADCSVIAELTRIVPRLSVALDHFYHAELLSLAAAQTRRNISVLPTIETGRQLIGVRPGPDCHTLAQAIQRLPHISLRGLFASAQTLVYPASRKTLPTAKVLALVQHSLAQLQQRGLPAHDALILADQPPTPELAANLPANAVLFCAPTPRIAPPPTFKSPQSVSVPVLSRPALEYCVIAAGSRSGLINQHTRVLLPHNASITSWSTHHAQLTLPSTALDLLIGQHAILSTSQ